MSEDPTSPTARWKPARAGIRNIWEYDDQVFEFADGRLVLRGPNGSGKSNALALLVPFLLDGVMASNRMDSLSGGRSMKTLLLCLGDDERSSRFRHDQRTGYAWLEFTHDDEHITIGCGARASTQRDADAWFFVTPFRPGIDLDLAPGGVPLTRSALAEILGPGSVHTSAEAYRLAVDRAVFGLGPHRYRNLVELLLVLRRPHLAGRLNLELLSKVLSDGLAALDDQMVATVAASFEDLEAVQDDLRRLQEAHRTVEVFLPVYRRYLRAVARSRATAAIEAERSRRAARRRVSDAEKAVIAATEEVDRIRLARRGCDDGREIAEQRQRAVLESPAYLTAMSLVDVTERADDAERSLRQFEARLQSARQEADATARELDAAVGAFGQAAGLVDQAFTAAGEAADLAGVGWSVGRDQVESEELARVVRGLGARRRHDIAEVRQELTKAQAASVRADSASDAAVRSMEAAGQAEQARHDAIGALDGRRALLLDEVRAWSDASGIPGLEVLTPAVDLVGEMGARSLHDVLADVLGPLREELAARDARAEDGRRALERRRAALVDERRRVADDPVPSPDPLASRPADRSSRGGAPLYACCDFADTVPADERAGLEAAIEAAGFLDAWVGERSDDLDAWLGPTPAVSTASVPSLADVLVATPPAGSHLTADAVRAVLASIALADTGIGVLADGRYHLGPLTGRFAKAEAEFIGASAREQRRLRLLADLDQQIAALTVQIARTDEERQEIAAEQHRLDQLSASLPSSRPVLEARDTLLSAVAAAKATTQAADRDQAVARQRRLQADAAVAVLQSTAVERRLPPTEDGLSESDQLLHGYEQQAQALVSAAVRLVNCREGHRTAAGRAARAQEAVTARTGERDDHHRSARGLHARVDQLRSQLGADAGAPLRELAGIEQELRELRAEADRLSDQASAAAQQQGRDLQAQAVAQEAVAAHDLAAAGAAARLDVLRRPDVWAVVGPDVTPPSDPVALAAAVDGAGTETTGEADQNALQRSYRQLLDELGRGYDPSLSYIDEVAVVEVTSDAGTFSVLWLAEELGKQVDRQQALLSERDREIFERHLLTRVSEALHELLNDADELVGRINRSLADRPTASGKSVQLRWELDTGDLAVRTALGLLRKSPELLGPDERDQLRRFFSTAIAQRRAEDPASGYAETLRHVLDYRSWHAFVPHVRSAGGGSQRLTAALFRTLSGGEQAVVLHLPLFAAAAAHYDAADAGAPRLIALDEAFAGIDEGMRAELMGLLVRFDLDIVLTGHELWGAYEQVPALMVYDLLRQPPLEGVSAFAVRWDGVAMAEA